MDPERLVQARAGSRPRVSKKFSKRNEEKEKNDLIFCVRRTIISLERRVRLYIPSDRDLLEAASANNRRGRGFSRVCCQFL